MTAATRPHETGHETGRETGREAGMTTGHPATRRADIGWAVIGTAGIAASSFLPALRAAGGGRALVVAGRDAGRAERWAADNGVESGVGVGSGVGDVERVLSDPRVQAVYVAVPNTGHLRWAAAALRAGKAVLCEKPLTPSPADTESMLAVARATPGPLWESFVFPFHPQTTLLRDILGSGAIGELRGISSAFHFRVRAPENIRFDPALAGGAVFDVGCYPVRLARLLFAAEPVAAAGFATVGDSGVDEDITAVLDFPGGRRLAVTAGLRRARDTYTRLAGTGGAIEVANAFHPVTGDLVRVRPESVTEPVDHAAGAGSVFEHAIRHIHAVLHDEAAPEHLAVDDALGQARAVAMLRGALGLPEPPSSTR